MDGWTQRNTGRHKYPGQACRLQRVPDVPGMQSARATDQKAATHRSKLFRRLCMMTMMRCAGWYGRLCEKTRGLASAQRRPARQPVGVCMDVRPCGSGWVLGGG